MRSRWFHVPLLHTESSGRKHASWLELFYDLIFVAAVLQLGGVIDAGVASGRPVEGFMWFSGYFVALWSAWSGFTFFANRFDVDDFLHRVFSFAHMFAMGALAITAPRVMLEVSAPGVFAAAMAVAQGLVALMYVRCWKQTPDAKEYSAFWGSMFAGSAVFWAVSIVLPSPWTFAAWAAGILILLGAPLSSVPRALAARYPIDQDHMSERFGLLTVFMLGVSFVHVLGFLAHDAAGVSAPFVVKGGLALAIVCSIWWTYFDDVAGSRLRPGFGRWVVWVFSHIPLGIGVTAAGVALQIAVTADLQQVAVGTERWLLAGSLALTLGAVAMIDAVTERRQAELDDAWRVRVRLGSSALLLLLAQAAPNISSGALLALVATVCLGQVAIDMLVAPLEEPPTLGAVPLKDVDLSRRRDPGAAGKPQRTTARDAVRKGLPSELRLDLYYFLIQGTWTQILVVMFGMFMLSNVVFALLFLLEPGSIGGAGEADFFDAFMFSVQTLSTIGYGAMSPATAYGDLIVTLEAAVGIIAVALATGIMFAKASRPESAVLFSEQLLITTWHGLPTLNFRAANARGNELVDASVSLTVLMDEVSAEGHHLRRLRDLPVTRERTPIFTLTWSVQHPIDEDSPLHGVDWSDDPGSRVLLIIVTIKGHDATYGQTTHAQQTYYADDVVVGHRFVDVISQLPDGRLMVDYDVFHTTEPVPGDPLLAPAVEEEPVAEADPR